MGDVYAAGDQATQRLRVQENLRLAGEPRVVDQPSNAILRPKLPIADVTIQNPFNYQDFEDDKLSVLDIKAIDDNGAVVNVEMQIGKRAGLDKRLVFYGCEVYADQLRAGTSYADLPPVFCVWLIDAVLWPEEPRFHHEFRLTDRTTGRTLDGTLAIHTIELPKYNSSRPDNSGSDMLAPWLLWLKLAQDYGADALLAAFPQPAMRRASETLIRIAQITKDKIMYDAREKAIRDRQWEMEAAKAEGKIELIRTLQEILKLPLGDENNLAAMGLARLSAMASELQAQARDR